MTAVIDDTLQIWDTSVYLLPNRRIYRGIGSGQAASLAFSPDGALLAVGTGQGWQIRSVPGFKTLKDEPGVAVYSTAFSPDGRLFAWGDESGMVHLWGVKSE